MGGRDVWRGKEPQSHHAKPPKKAIGTAEVCILLTVHMMRFQGIAGNERICKVCNQEGAVEDLMHFVLHCAP
jgi:hypothetical protein